MKNERRHQLERNELADRLGEGIQSVQSMLPLLLAGVAILIVGSVGWGLYSSSAKKKEALAWTEYYFNLSGGDADAFLDLADGFPDSQAAGWARQTAGDSFLEQGIQAIYRNRSEGEELLGKAIDAFEQVESQATVEELRAKALLGLAHAHETLGNLDEAASYYEQYTGTSAPPGQVSAVNERLAFLTSPTGKEFYTWFSKLDPKPDSAIELPGNLSLPPTLEESGLQFGPTGSSSSTGATGTSDAEISTNSGIDPSSIPLPDLSGGAQPPATSGPIDLPDPANMPEAPGAPSPNESAPADPGGTLDLQPSAGSDPSKEDPAKEDDAGGDGTETAPSGSDDS